MESIIFFLGENLKTYNIIEWLEQKSFLWKNPEIGDFKLRKTFYKFIFVQLLDSKNAPLPILLRFVQHSETGHLATTKVRFCYTTEVFLDEQILNNDEIDKHILSITSNGDLDPSVMYQLANLYCQEKNVDRFQKDLLHTQGKKKSSDSATGSIDLDYYLGFIFDNKVTDLEKVASIFSPEWSESAENPKFIKVIYKNEDIYDLIEEKVDIETDLLREAMQESSDPFTSVRKILRVQNLSKRSKKQIVKLALKVQKQQKEKDRYREALDQLTEIPYDSFDKDNEISEVRKYLDENIYGMNQVKVSVLRFLAKRKLNPASKPKTLCLVGSPGVGKTYFCSILAKAIGREFYSVALGGLDSASLINGITPSYTGADSGQIIRSMILSQKANPLILLDEIDKVSGTHSGSRAAITSCLLELLDPNQNTTFKDHFLQVEIDVSNIWFISTANEIKPISMPLLDRMQVLELPDYTYEDKKVLFETFIWKKNLQDAGLESMIEIIWDETAKEKFILDLNEPGVRELDKKLGDLCGGIALDLCTDKLEKGNKLILTESVVKKYMLETMIQNKNKIGFDI